MHGLGPGVLDLPHPAFGHVRIQSTEAVPFSYGMHSNMLLKTDREVKLVLWRALRSQG